VAAAKPELAVKPFRSETEWQSWLERNHDNVPGLWVKFAKKASGIPTVTYDEAVEVALCYGWIDGLVKSVDDDYYLQRFTPRRAKSKWSKINRDRATALIATGRMKPAGLAQVQAAKTDGRWDAAYDSPGTIAVPEDLQAALDNHPAAKDFFAKLDSQNRYYVLYGIHDAKRPETRARRIANFVAKLNAGQKPLS
jgi:uncharacterized protein YdeI (YjbR/CyaY-like superfamily)